MAVQLCVLFALEKHITLHILMFPSQTNTLMNNCMSSGPEIDVLVPHLSEGRSPGERHLEIVISRL